MIRIYFMWSSARLLLLLHRNDPANLFFSVFLAADVVSRNFFGSLWSPVGSQRGWVLPSVQSVLGCRVETHALSTHT